MNIFLYINLYLFGIIKIISFDCIELIQTKMEFSKVSLSSIIIRRMEETDERKTLEIYVITEGSNNERATW